MPSDIVKIVWIYPDLLSTYGDRGNCIVLERRAKLRGIPTRTVNVHSDGNANPHAPNGYTETIHRFAKPGHYIVRVEGKAQDGTRAVMHLQVRVEDKTSASK